MNENAESEEELIRLSQILETVREDVIETTELIVNGIEYYQIVGIFCIVLALFSTSQFGVYINSADYVSAALWGFFSVLLWPTAFYGFYKNRKLRKKHAELIDIHKSLSGE